MQEKCDTYEDGDGESGWCWVLLMLVDATSRSASDLDKACPCLQPLDSASLDCAVLQQVRRSTRDSAGLLLACCYFVESNPARLGPSKLYAFLVYSGRIYTLASEDCFDRCKQKASPQPVLPNTVILLGSMHLASMFTRVLRLPQACL